jgi:hypothetical protein
MDYLPIAIEKSIFYYNNMQKQKVIITVITMKM